MKPNLIIGISGISGAGKSTLTHALASKLNATSLFWDDFDAISKSPEDYVEWYKNGGNPAEFDYQSLADIICSLKDGNEITHPITNHLLKPTPYIIVDAPLGKTHHQTAQFIDFFIHINIPLDIALARRIIRDVQNHHLHENEIIEELNHYLTDSRPLFADEGMSSIAGSADYTIDGQKKINEQVDAILNYIKKIGLFAS